MAASVFLQVIICSLICSLFSVFSVGGRIIATDQVSEFTYANFTSALPGSNTVLNGTLILTQSTSLNSMGTAWFGHMMQVRGFISKFTYTITNNSRNANQRPDGIAFVIQASGAADSATGSPGGGLGYGAASGNPSGIQNSVAVEFDSWYNLELNDPRGFHIGVHSRADQPNNANEQYRIGNVWVNDVYDLDTQDVTITYDPIVNGGSLTFQFNDQPAHTVTNLSIEALAQLDPVEGNAYVGFTAASHNGTAAMTETIAVRSWTFSFLGSINAANTQVFVNESVVAGEELTLSVQAFDQYNYSMIIDGAGRSNYELTATLTTSDGAVQTSVATYSGYGKYVLAFNATKSGIATVRAFLNSTVIGAGDYALTVVPAAPFALLSIPFGFMPDVVAGVNGSFYVQLRDVFGNNITTDVGSVVETIIIPQFDSSYSQSVMGVYAPDVPFQCYVVTYNITLAGNFTLQVKVSGANASDSVHSVVVKPAAVAPRTSVLFSVDSVAIAGELQRAYLQLKDVFGNNATDTNVDVYIQASQDTTVVNGTLGNCTDEGLCEISYNLTVASYNMQYHIVVLVNQVPVYNSGTTTVIVNPAALSPAASYAYGMGITMGVAGEVTYFYVQLTDTFGNNNSVPLATVTPRLTTATGSFVTSPVLISIEEGRYTYQYNVSASMSYLLSITVNGQNISNSQSSVSIAPNVVYPPNCVGFGPGLGSQLVVGAENVFYVQLRDEFHNNISTNGTESINVVIENDALKVNATTIFEDGLYEVTYNITVAATYNITTMINYEPIMDAAQNITLEPAAIYPQECVATNIAEGVAAGTVNNIQVQLRDVYSNEITSVQKPDGVVTTSFLPTFSGGSVLITVTYTGNGRYSLTYNATVAGGYELTILVNDTAILGGGKYAVQVSPAAAFPLFCVVNGSALENSVAGQKSSFFIYLVDAYYNPITSPSSNDTPVVTISEQEFTMAFDTSVGAYVVSYNITESSKHFVTVNVNGIQITNSVLNVVPAPLYAPNCLANGTYLAGATAGDLGEVFVFQRDQFGNLITEYSQVGDINVTMLLEGIQTINPHPTPNGDGSYTFSYNVTVAGYYTTSITINGIPILDSPFTTLISAAPFDPHGTTTQGLSNNTIAGDLNSFTIQLRDIYGNDVTDTNVPNPVTPGDISVHFNNTPIDRNVTVQSDGVFLVQYTYTKAGVYWMNVTINGTEVGTSPPGNIVIQPNSVYPPACTAIGDATAEAIVKQTNSFILVVRDQYNNNRMWSPIPPTVTLVANGLNAIYGSAENQTNGTYLVNYFITEKTTYTMSITFSGEHIHGSPFKVDTNYGNDSPSTVVIVCSVVGSVVVVGAIVGGFIWYKRRRTPYIAILE